jgi:hypothetical protein
VVTPRAPSRAVRRALPLATPHLARRHDLTLMRVFHTLRALAGACALLLRICVSLY